MRAHGLALQSLISRALEDDNFVVMASVELSTAFDIVDVKLLSSIHRHICIKVYVAFVTMLCYYSHVTSH